MKNLLIKFLTVAIVLTISLQSLVAQSTDNQMYFIRMMKVMPSKSTEFEKADKTFMNSIREAKIAGLEVYGNATMDYQYYFAVPIDNFAELDENFWSEVIGKLGLERFMKEVDAVASCISEETTGVYLNRRDLGYIHPSIAENIDKMNYRVWDIYQFKSGTSSKVKQLCKEYQTLCKKYDLKLNASFYFAILGQKSESVINLSFAKDAEDFAKQQKEFYEKSGAEGKTLWAKVEALLVSHERKTGYFRPDLSIFPISEKPMAAEKK
ncbi:MAG: hypothetical protein ACI8YQ_004807 [Polaribacter sp.]|jgi:hypothetical protein